MPGDTTPFHPLIDAMLSDFEAREGGPVLSDQNLRKWRKSLKSEPEARQRLAEELVILAVRFARASARPSMMQVVVLAALLIGDMETQTLLEQSGLATDDARRLVREARGAADPLAKGLTPRAPGGLKLRK